MQQPDVVSQPQGRRAGEQPPVARSVSVFIAAYNEVENLGPTVETVVRALEETVGAYEIIVVNDGSTDGTREVADRLASENPRVLAIHNPGNKGLGYGWLRAVEVASQATFVFIPGDNTWPYSSLRDLFGSMGRADVITSYPTNSEIRVPARRYLSVAYTTALNLLFGLRLQYYHGLTIYPIEYLRSGVITTYGFASMSEALLRAIHRGYSYHAVPCAIEERATGRSKAVSLHSLTSVIDTIGRLFLDLRLRSRRGPHSTLGLFGPARPHRRPANSTSAPSTGTPSTYGDA